ncbi:MAG: chorismate-binding protein, partial [Terracidiphilus sp.]
MKRRHSLPAEVYALVDETPATVLLDGGKPGGANNQAEPREEPWTCLFTAPLCICAAYAPAEIPALFQEIESAVRSGLWAAGFFTYECGNYFEPKAQMRQNPQGPLAWFGIYASPHRFDHQTGRFADGEPEGLAELRRSAGAQGVDAGPGHRLGVESASAPGADVDAEFAISQAEYARRIAAIQEWIRSGDVYQLNFTAPWKIESRVSVAALYAGLRARQPVEYGAFLHWRQGRRILSFSPELFFRVETEDGARRIVTRPMKGTAPRGRTAREDPERA